MAAKKGKPSESGQATFEFLIFLPFLLVFIGIFVSISGAINSAINQEKTTRAYFYRLIKGSAYLIQKKEFIELADKQQVGNFVIGFRNNSVGKESVLPCYRLKIFLSGTISEDCDKKSTDPAGPTFLIKVSTLYGVCGPTYVKSGQDFVQSFDAAANGMCGLK